MRFTNERYVTKATDNAFDAGEVVEKIIDDFDPNDGGELERIQSRVSNLTTMLSIVVELLTDSQQRDLVAKYEGWKAKR